MNYVFYDLETSGRSSSWDQIIEVGAVLVNDNFQVLADPLNIRCSLKPGLVPEPYALIVNNTTPQILRKTNLSHYGMLSQMVEQFNKWSPAVFVGYNSISFDEEFLRKSLFKTLTINLNCLEIKRLSMKYDHINKSIHQQRLRIKKFNSKITLECLAPLGS